MDYPLNEEEIVKLTDQKDLFALGCDMDNLYISYNKDNHREAAFHLDSRSNIEASVLHFNQPYVFFDKNGTVANVQGVALSGAWAKNRVADLLPYNYEPEANAAATKSNQL